MSVIAERRLKQFQQKFGKAMVKFATHAALPVVLNSELVHLLRINFFYSDTSISYLTEAEFLLSSFCREIGEDLYEIEPAMRTVLLQKLYQQHPKHIKEIAALLWQYTKRYTPWRTREGLQNAQLLTALNFLDAQKASEWFQEVESLDKALSQEDREWFVAMKSKIESEQQLQRSEKFSTSKVTHHKKASHEEESKLWADGKIDFKKYIQIKLEQATVKISTTSGFKGTGFFISFDGYILTTWHCINEVIILMSDITVEMINGDTFDAQVDEDKSIQADDIAVLKIEHKSKHCVPLGFITKYHRGDEVIAVGYPATYILENQQIGIYFGRISRLRSDNKIEIIDAIKGPGQTGAPIYHYATNRVIGIAVETYKSEVMTNTGLATRFEPLFEKWPELEKINEVVAKTWMERLQELSKSEKLPKQSLKNVYEHLIETGFKSLSGFVSRMFLNKRTSAIKNFPPIESCGGAMPLDSKFYVERRIDADFKRAIQRRDSIVLLKGSRQVGRSSLLARGIHTAYEAGTQILLTDFQKLNEAQLQNLETFFIAIGEMLAVQLELEVYPEDKWRSKRHPNMNFDNYFQREILRKTDKQLLWAFDEVDRLLLCNFSSEVFSLFRTWHNDRALNPNSLYSKLTLVIAYSTETYLFTQDQNQSPFNVGTKLVLEDFTLENLADLNQRYGMPLKNDKEIKKFHQLVGGHPYLVRCGLNDLVSYKMTLDEFINKATRDDGIYGDHLLHIIMLLNHDEQLLQAMQKVLHGQSCPNYDSFYRLRSAGILKGDSKDNVSFRCELYKHYLKKHLT